MLDAVQLAPVVSRLRLSVNLESDAVVVEKMGMHLIGSLIDIEVQTCRKLKYHLSVTCRSKAGVIENMNQGMRLGNRHLKGLTNVAKLRWRRVLWGGDLE